MTVDIPTAAKPKKRPSKINFTVSTLKAVTCPAGKSREYYYDARTPGLTYCITDRGARSFYLYKRVAGKPERIRLGGEEITIEQARTLAAKRNGEIANGQNPREDARQRKAEKTVGEAWDWYLANHAKPHKRSWKTDEKLYTSYLSEWSARRLSSIKSSDVQELHTRIGENTGKIQANRVIGVLRGVYNIASDKLGYNGRNPAAKITKFKENERERFLMADEMPRFFEALAQEPSQRIRDYFTCLLFTGQRKSNVAAMEWAHVNVAAQTWAIPPEQAKSGKSITVPLVPEVVEVLTRRHAEKGECRYVFPGQGKTGHLVDPKIPFQRLRRRAGLTDVRIHDLRRTQGSWQAAGGASLQIIGRSLGHTSERATRIYSRLQLDPVRESMNTAAAAMRAAADVKDGGK
jgi:integrase